MNVNQAIHLRGNFMKNIIINHQFCNTKHTFFCKFNSKGLKYVKEYDHVNFYFLFNSFKSGSDAAVVFFILIEQIFGFWLFFTEMLSFKQQNYHRRLPPLNI